MKPERPHRPPHADESGVYIILLALLIAAMLALSALAVEAGRYYLMRVQMQKAADAAALNGAAKFGFMGDQEIKALVQRVAADNLRLAGISFDDKNLSKTISATVTGNDRRVRVSISAPARPLVVPLGSVLVPTLSAASAARKPPLAVVIAADASSTMLCPASGESCNKPKYKGSKLEALFFAGAQFIDVLDGTQDALAVVGFNDSAYPVLPMMHPFDGQAVKDSFFTFVIEGLPPYRNHHIALISAREQFAALEQMVGSKAYGDFVKLVLIVTDGGPTMHSGKLSSLNLNALCPKAARKYAWPVIESDALRTEGAYIYTIGVGPGLDGLDEWWTVPNADIDTPNPYFLRRMSNAASQAAGDKPLPSACAQAYSELMMWPKGMQVEVLSADELKAMVNRLWRTVQLRLVE